MGTIPTLLHVPHSPTHRLTKDLLALTLVLLRLPLRVAIAAITTVHRAQAAQLIVLGQGLGVKGAALCVGSGQAEGEAAACEQSEQRTEGRKCGCSHAAGHNRQQQTPTQPGRQLA